MNPPADQTMLKHVLNGAGIRHPGIAGPQLAAKNARVQGKAIPGDLAS
jgi:hypothetical protein